MGIENPYSSSLSGSLIDLPVNADEYCLYFPDEQDDRMKRNAV